MFFAVVSLLILGCGSYSFTGISISADTKTFQVNYFQNSADLIEPGIERDFTLALQDIILNQTNLSLVKSNGDLIYEGEIVEESDFEKRFSFFYDYAGSAQLIGSQKTTAMKEIYDRITQDIINASLANW